MGRPQFNQLRALHGQHKDASLNNAVAIFKANRGATTVMLGCHHLGAMHLQVIVQLATVCGVGQIEDYFKDTKLCDSVQGKSRMVKDIPTSKEIKGESRISVSSLQTKRVRDALSLMI